MNPLELIAALRGGIPLDCDFCGQPYGERRHPIPEEAGEWTCNECWNKWEEQALKEKNT